MSRKKEYIDYEEYLIESLKDPNEAREYLNAALTDEDPRVFLLALRHVIEAQGYDMSEISRKANLNRENLHRMLSNKGNPKFLNIKSVLHTLSLELAVQPYNK